LSSRLGRLLFVAIYAKGEPVAAAKRRFLVEHRISARQFNAIHNQVRAQVDSWRECRKLNLDTVTAQISKLSKAIPTLRTPFAVHQKKRRLAMLQARKARIEAELAAPTPTLCFGSRHRFKGQFDLQANGYASHSGWLTDWRESRAASFFVLGSADETCGNQSCQYRAGQLHLRLPDALSAGHTLTIPVTFAYREQDLLAALTPKLQVVTRGPNKGEDTLRGNAISYRFVRQDGHWYVYVSFATVAAPIKTRRGSGCVGVDLNPWGLAVTCIDRFGNIADHFDIPWSIEDRRQHQVKASIGDAVRAVTLYAEQHGLPLAIERLDFDQAKKRGLNAVGNRMLSAFAYAAFAQMIQGRCAREGIELIAVNPAFTSIIGRGKFAVGYGLSVHRAAAAVIARRALDFGEKLRTRSAGTALELPARNRTRHVWHNWSLWAKTRSPRRGISTQPKGSRGLQPQKDRGVRPDPVPPNGGACDRRAGTAMPTTAFLTRGAIPQASREHCSHGDLGQMSKPALQAG
jgi:IS605 OrfB family transposase